MSTKKAYQQKLNAKLDEWNADINKLKAKADSAEADVKLEYHEQIENLKEKQTAAEQKLNELTQASDAAWEDLKAGTESAWNSLGNAVQNATARFK